MSRGWNAGYFIREGFFSIFKHGLMSFAAVCMMVACLIIMGSFSLVALNADNMMGDMERENEILAYVDETLNEQEVAALGDRLVALPNVASATFVSRGDALTDYQERQGSNNALLKDLPESVVRHRYAIRVVDISMLSQTVDSVVALPGVANIAAAPEVAAGMVAARNVATAVATILVVILVIISLFIISNTIKLATFYRRDEIAIMKMCGATNGFIRWPFVIEGLILGLLGALVAFFLQWGIYALVIRAVEESGKMLFLNLLDFQTVWLWVLGAFAGTGVVIGVGGSLLAIRKFLQV